MVSWYVVQSCKKKLVVLSGGASCRPERQGKGPVVQGAWRCSGGGSMLPYVKPMNTTYTSKDLS